MVNRFQYTIKYQHGDELVREEETRFINGRVNEFAVDIDKLWHWYLLGDVKELGYDIKKDVRLTYKDGEGVFRSISDKQTIVGLTEQLMSYKTVGIYVETSNTMHEKGCQKPYYLILALIMIVMVTVMVKVIMMMKRYWWMSHL